MLYKRKTHSCVPNMRLNVLLLSFMSAVSSQCLGPSLDTAEGIIDESKIKIKHTQFKCNNIV